ncbi:MAG: CsoS2 family carboxysome shell protein [Gammaproteobacteria bacterium]|nr:CsoS2 family carboxysome shell protein [Gammaproteobacteria bacterium]
MVSSAGSTREVARRRRAALAEAGRKAEATRDRTRADAIAPSRGSRAEAVKEQAGKKGDCGCGCKGEGRESTAPVPAPERRASLTPTSRTSPGRGQPRRVNATMPAARAASKARRAAQSATGKSASASPTSMAGIARQANPSMSTRELAQSIREQRSRNGRSSSTKSAPCGRVRSSRTAGDRGDRGAQDATWKVGTSETGGGQTVTGTRVGRAKGVTGDEPSTCRAVTGTEYMGADIFREFCQTDPQRSPLKVGISPTTRGNRVTGNEVGRSSHVTGDEPGTCKNVTGTEYLSPDQFDTYCGIRPAPGPAKVSRTQTAGGERVSGVMVGQSSKVTGNEYGAGVKTTGSQYTQPQETQSQGRGKRGGVPPKVGTSTTFTGGTVTGTRTGRSERVTGDEPGSCKRVTGDEYVDLNQYEAFCASRPEPSPPKVEQTHTLVGRTVTGTRTGRATNVTGDEPGTCKSITGTPYGPAEDYETFCAPQARPTAMARAQRRSGPVPGANLTGIQPGVGGGMTGAERGACEPVSGTPYVGSDDFGATCGALPGQEDFPQALDGAPWQSFSVESPARMAHQARAQGGVTGTRYEQGQITGAFNMGTGKVTGTEEFRFDHRRAGNANLMDMAPASPGTAKAGAVAPAAEEKPRVTGEGQSAGLKITGDDWDRNERVTGTEGTSAMRRNPTRRGGPTSVMLPPKRNQEAPEPVSLVTGSAGTTDKGSLITYSGGARG